MFSHAEYINGWLVYGLGVFIGLACWYYLIRKLPIKSIKSVLFGVMVGMLTMPWPTKQDGDSLAPAWIIAGAEGIFDGAEAFYRAGVPMLLAMLCGGVVALTVYIILNRLKN